MIKFARKSNSVGREGEGRVASDLRCLCVSKKKKVPGCLCLAEEEKTKEKKKKKNQHNEPKLPLCLTLSVSLHPLIPRLSDSCFCAAKLTAPQLLLESLR